MNSRFASCLALSALAAFETPWREPAQAEPSCPSHDRFVFKAGMHLSVFLFTSPTHFDRNEVSEDLFK